MESRASRIYRLPSLRRSDRYVFLFAAAAALTLVSATAKAQDQCALAKDLVVQALERVKTGTNDEASDGLQLLKHATEICINSGDAWYYRAIFERKLGDAAKADYALKKAKSFGSEAMDQDANPFRLATGAAAGTATPIGPVHEKWALVVGISKFRDTHLHHLTFASKDAKDFSALLLDPNVGRFKPSNVHSLTEGEVTVRQLKTELNWLTSSATDPNDLVVIFLSTHGTPRSKDVAEVNYIATSETETEPEGNLYLTGFPMAQFSDDVRSRIKARRTVIFLDTCHSGGAIGGKQTSQNGAGRQDSSASNSELERINQGVGRIILTSSSPEEQSYEGPPYTNGYFTHFLLEALRHNGGKDPIDQIYASVKQNVSQAAGKIQRKQTPVLSRSQQSPEIVIGAP